MAHVNAVDRRDILAAARRLPAPFRALSVAAMMPALPTRRVVARVHALARRGYLRRVGAAPPRSWPGRVATLFDFHAVAVPAVRGTPPDLARADQRWGERVVAGVRFDIPITATEALQLRRIAGWQSD